MAENNWKLTLPPIEEAQLREHLHLLGLPPEADLAAVNAAYERLKWLATLDQESQPTGVTLPELRQIEAAYSWLLDHSDYLRSTAEPTDSRVIVWDDASAGWDDSRAELTKRVLRWAPLLAAALVMLAVIIPVALNRQKMASRPEASPRSAEAAVSTVSPNAGQPGATADTGADGASTGVREPGPGTRALPLPPPGAPGAAGERAGGAPVGSAEDAQGTGGAQPVMVQGERLIAIPVTPTTQAPQAGALRGATTPEAGAELVPLGQGEPSVTTGEPTGPVGTGVSAPAPAGLAPSAAGTQSVREEAAREPQEIGEPPVQEPAVTGAQAGQSPGGEGGAAGTPVPPDPTAGVPDPQLDTDSGGGEAQDESVAAGAPDFTGVPATDRVAMESACRSERVVRGPAAYHDCLAEQLGAYVASAGPPDLSAVPAGDMSAMESVCRSVRTASGPAAYNDCLWEQYEWYQTFE